MSSASVELADKGNAMRRPHADYLRDGMHELRATLEDEQYRILYFFFARHAVTLSHGTTKESKVAPQDIELAIERRNLVMQSPDRYTADLDLDG